jgi:uncharacterized Zn-binding protein involved in type VI secretion
VLVGAVVVLMCLRFGIQVTTFAVRLRRAARLIGAGDEPRLHARVIRNDQKTLTVVPAAGPAGDPLVLTAVLHGLKRVHLGDEVLVDGRTAPGSVVAVSSGTRLAWLLVRPERRRLAGWRRRSRDRRGPATDGVTEPRRR